MNILYITTIGGTMRFFGDFIKTLLDEGHTVDIMCNETTREVPEYYKDWGCQVLHHSATRNPFSVGTLKAIKEIKKLISLRHYDIIHCHTPVAAMCTRLACRKLRKTQGVKVFYTAHGFHFYNGAPKKNWLVYYPIEKFCSKFTDILITINGEDFELAKKKFKADQIRYVPGVGIDLNKYKCINVDRKEKRMELGVPDDAFLLMSVGELNENKNHQVVIRALAKIDDPRIHYAVAGRGHLDEYLMNLASELGVSDRFHLLGYRTDVAEIYKAADVFVFPSHREGLSVSLMEAMASGLPCIVSRIRGNVDLIKHEYNGLLCKHNDVDAFVENVNKLRNNNDFYWNAVMKNSEIVENYDVKNINQEMYRIYFE